MRLRPLPSLLCALALGCDPSGGAACDPGEVQVCYGAGGCVGGQSCRADGAGWEACDCDAPPPVCDGPECLTSDWPTDPDLVGVWSLCGSFVEPDPAVACAGASTPGADNLSITDTGDGIEFTYDYDWVDCFRIHVSTEGPLLRHGMCDTAIGRWLGHAVPYRVSADGNYLTLDYEALGLTERYRHYVRVAALPDPDVCQSYLGRDPEGDECTPETLPAAPTGFVSPPLVGAWTCDYCFNGPSDVVVLESDGTMTIVETTPGGVECEKRTAFTTGIDGLQVASCEGTLFEQTAYDYASDVGGYALTLHQWTDGTIEAWSFSLDGPLAGPAPTCDTVVDHTCAP